MILGTEQPRSYAAGFLVTTAGLHLVGAAGGAPLLESRRGKRWLGQAGVAMALVGGDLFVA
ncbi:MAG: hypothetical protein HGA45_11860 [Chloroflexales bacterium]|nr:hypothetical protein [Chloroflexales bacterium]